MDDEPPNALRRLTLLQATTLVVASMVGAGVFTTTGLLLNALPSAPAVLAAWLIGGVTALCGALSYAELGAALPSNGGEYQLLARIYNPAIGFVAGWVSFVVGFSAPLAAVALSFGLDLSRTMHGVDPMAAALIAIALLTAVHAARVSFGGVLHSAFTSLEVALVFAFAMGSFWAGVPSRLLHGTSELYGRLGSHELAVDLIFVSFASGLLTLLAGALLYWLVRNPRSLDRKA